MADRNPGRSATLAVGSSAAAGALVQGARRSSRASTTCAPSTAAGRCSVHAGLERAAGRLARLLLTEGQLDHDAGAPFDERLEHAAPAAHLWGENLAWGSGEGARPDEIVEGWMNSPEHRAIMLDCRFSQVGIGVASGALRRPRLAAASTPPTSPPDRIPGSATR